MLQNIGSALIEIHGQNEKIGLLDVGLHVKLLDRYASHSVLLKKLEDTYKSYKTLSNIYLEAKELNKNKAKYEEDLKNNINLISKLDFKEGEEKNLNLKRYF